MLNFFINARRGGLFNFLIGTVLILLSLAPGMSSARIYIDINAPSIRKFKIAIPDFKYLTSQNEQPELITKLPGVLSNDLDLSGYFSPMDKGAFLEQEDAPLTIEGIRFKDWTVIGADLLLKGGYICIGRSLEVEVRLFDVFQGRQIFGMRGLGDIARHRYLMHRIANQVIRILTGNEGVFLTKLAFVGNATGNKEIYVCDYDGHNVRQVTNDRSIALSPEWSPDGESIIFNSYKDGTGPILYTKDIQSGGTKRLSGRKGLNIGACWAPDQSEMALTLSLKGNPDIFTIDLNGKIKKRLTDHWGIDVSPSFSPDGKKMAFVSNRSGSPQIYVRDLLRGSEERLTFEGNYNTSPSWSKLGRIAFVSMDRGRFDIYTIRSDGGQLRRLTEDQGDNEDPCWSPDGRYIMFSSNRTGRYHLYMMSRNGQNQRKITSLKGDQTAPSWGQ
jgi:TolB protein